MRKGVSELIASSDQLTIKEIFSFKKHLTKTKIMNSTKIRVIAMAICLLQLTFLAAQPLVLQKGKRTKSIKEGKWLNIYTAIPSDGCCPDKNFDLNYGKLVGVTEDSIILEVYIEHISRYECGEYLERTLNYEEPGASFQKSLAKHNIELIMQGYSPEKAEKKDSRNVMGKFFLTAGILTAGQSFIANKGEGRERLLILGTASTVLGTLLMSFNASKKYYISNSVRQKDGQNEPLWHLK